jgi:hypothetical protein
VPTLEDDGWQLESGVERHAEAPETFEIPGEQVRTRLVPTCGAKLIFSMRTDAGVQVERMWVEIAGYTDVGYLGKLLNQPQSPGAPLRPGDHVEFEPDHIIDAEPPPNWDPATGYDHTKPS